jgi:hypothetical protein
VTPAPTTPETTSSIDDPGEPREPKWTVMVFMAAETIEGSAPLHDAADADLAEMEFVGSGGGLNIFVQLHGYGEPRRHHLGVTEDPVPAHQLDQTEGKALGHFVEYALAAAKHRPDDYSMLVLWGHAYDFAFGRSHKPDGTVDALEFVALSKLLKQLQENYLARFALAYPNRKLPENPRLDILGFDACDLSTVEMACQLQPFANYVLGSEIGIPIPGWPYDRVLDRLRNPKGRVMGPAEAGAWIVRRYCESYTSEQRTVSLTLLDLDRIPELFAYGDVLALTLIEAINRDRATRPGCRAVFGFAHGGRPALRRCRGLVPQSRPEPRRSSCDRGGAGAWQLSDQPTATRRERQLRRPRQTVHRGVRQKRGRDGAPQWNQRLRTARRTPP